VYLSHPPNPAYLRAADLRFCTVCAIREEGSSTEIGKALWRNQFFPARDMMFASSSVQGRIQVNDAWSLELCEPFKRQLEGDRLVLTRPGLVFVVKTWWHETSIDECCAAVREQLPAEAAGIFEEREGRLRRFGYRLNKVAGPQDCATFCGVAVGRASYVQLAAFFQQESELGQALAAWRSLREPTPLLHLTRLEGSRLK
jgi:hypothetical protein